MTHQVKLLGDHRQGRSQGRVLGVLEPPFWVMKMDIISRGKKVSEPPFRNTARRDFRFLRRTQENQFKVAQNSF